MIMSQNLLEDLKNFFENISSRKSLNGAEFLSIFKTQKFFQKRILSQDKTET